MESAHALALMHVISAIDIAISDAQIAKINEILRTLIERVRTLETARILAEMERDDA